MPELAKLPHRAIWTVAIPAMATAVATALIGIVDTWAIGQTNDAHAMAGVAIGAMLFAVLLFSFNFLRMGTTGLTAQAFGAADKPEQLRILLRGFGFAVAISVLILLLNAWVIRGGLYALGAELQVHAQATSYAKIRLLSLPIALLSMVMVGHLMGVQAMRAVLKIEIIYNLANAAMCILLVQNGQISPAALAWVNIAAEGVKFLCLAGLMLSRYRQGLWQSLRDKATWPVADMIKLAAINRDLFLRTALLMLCMAMMTRTGANAGATALAANQILFQFFVLAALVLDGFEAAAQTLGGAAVGANNRADFTYLVRGCLFWGGLTAILIAFFYALFGTYVLGQFTDNRSVIADAKPLLVWAALCPIVGVWSFVYDGTYIGAAWTRGMLVTMAAGAAAYFILLFLLVPVWGMNGLWMAFLALFAVRGLTQALLYPKLRAATFAEMEQQS